MKKSVLLGIIGVLLVVGVGITFAYFTSGVEVSGEGSTVELQPGDMIKVTYDAGDSSLSSNNLIPGDTVSKTFTVTVTPTETEKTAVYAIYLDLTNNTFVKCDDSNYNSITNACIKDYEELTYTIKDGDNVLATGDLTGKTGKVKLLTETKTVDSETTFTYTLEITFHETNADQNHNMEKVINGNIKVEFYFETMSEQIENLYTDNSTILAYDGTADNNLRYIGADPNNYVLFNNELWRIIGVFNENSHGVAGQKLVKLIRNESIGSFSWDNKASGTGSSTSSYGSNDWSDSALQLVLNEGAYWNRTNGTCPSGQNGATTNCDFSTNGLTDEAKSMIETVTWKLGGTGSFTSASNGLTSHFYGYERGTTVYSGRPTTWQGKIALMYPSDYGYATSGGSTTNREACLAKELYNWDSSSYSDCKNNDWLLDSSTTQWTLTPTSSRSDNVFGVFRTGCVNYNSANDSIGVRPSVYLTSNVGISGGDGTMNNPYILKA